MPFHFPMQKILDYREQLEEEARIRMAMAETRVRQSEERVDEVRHSIFEAEERARTEPVQNAAEFWLTEQYLKGLREDLASAEHALTLARALREESQKLLTARAVDKKLLATLKERQKKAWTREALRKEQLGNDEIATIRYKKAPAR